MVPAAAAGDCGADLADMGGLGLATRFWRYSVDEFTLMVRAARPLPVLVTARRCGLSALNSMKVRLLTFIRCADYEPEEIPRWNGLTELHTTVLRRYSSHRRQRRG